MQNRRSGGGFAPAAEVVERYGELLVRFALGGGEGIRAGEVVGIAAPEAGKPLYLALRRAVWRAGGHVIDFYRPDEGGVAQPPVDLIRDGSAEQLSFLPGRYWRGAVDELDHLVHVRADADPTVLRDADPARILAHERALRPVVQWLDAKENAGRLSWTVASYGTEGMAREAGLSLTEYWAQIVAACYLDEDDPVARWRAVDRQIATTAARLTALPIERLHVAGEDADLRITLGERRRWLGGGGRNVPSFEVFTSPDWRGTEGWIRFSEPLYVHGNLITGIRLEFAGGRVISASAEANEPLLQEMLRTPGADRLGEFSLTDRRLSRITRFMADTLYDENVGGPFGNTHVALGRALRFCYAGDAAAVAEEEWERLGFNDCATHNDIVSTTDRTVTAVLADGSERVIYAEGRFTLE